MSDICYYEIHVKGSKKACWAYLNTTPRLDKFDILKEEGTDDEFIIHYSNCCKGSLNCYCIDGFDEIIDVNSFTLEEIKNDFDLCGLLSVTSQEKSKVLGVSVEIYMYSEDNMYKCFYKYDKGIVLFEEEDFYLDLNEKYETSDKFTF